MAITDGTTPGASTPGTSQDPNTKPEIKLNLDFDEGKTSDTSLTLEGTNTPIQEQVPSTQVLQITPEEIPTPSEAAVPSASPIENVPPTAPIQNIQTQAQGSDNRLAQEDALLETKKETVPVIQEVTPVTQETPTETPIQTVSEVSLENTQNIKEPLPVQEPIQPVQEVSISTSLPQEPKPQQTELTQQDPLPTTQAINENIPQTSLQEDMNIIQNLSLEKTNTSTPTSAPQTPSVQAEPQAQTNTINLDNLLQANPAPAPSAPINFQQNAPINQAIPTTTPTQEIQNPISEEKKTKGTKILLFVLLFVSLGAVTFFVLKTMYPVEFSGVSFPTGDNQSIIDSGMLNTDIASGTSNSITGDLLSGDTIFNDSLSGQTDISGQHGSAGDAMFSDLQDLGTTASSDVLISKLHAFIDQGTTLFEQGKATNDKLKIKFGGYIRNKATSLANSLESGEQLDTQVVQNYLAQFSGYLSQLQPATNEANTQGSSQIPSSLSGETPAVTTPTQDSGTSDTTSISKAQ